LNRSVALAALTLAGLLPPAAAGANVAYDPDVPVPPPFYTPLPQRVAPPAVLGERGWRDANDQVGAMSRGHIDILKWEAANQPPSTAAPAPGQPAAFRDLLRSALSNRPALFASIDLNTIERARADIAVVEFARDLELAWIDAIAARQALALATREVDIAGVAAELALRMVQVGNWGQDRLLREQLAQHEAGQALARARQADNSATEALIRWLGSWGENAAPTLPDSLPAPPLATPPEADLEARALRQHPQLSLSRYASEQAARGLSQRARDDWKQAVEAALGALAPDTDDPGHAGPRALTAPVLDRRHTVFSHDAERAARLDAEAHTLAVTIRSQVREAYHQYRLTHELALAAADAHRLARAAQEETLLRYNGMLKSTWDLLIAARARLASEAAAIMAQRDFWRAHAQLQAVLAGGNYTGADAVGSAGKSTNASAGGH